MTNTSKSSEIELPEQEYLILVSSLATLGRGLLQHYQLPLEAGGLILKLAFHAASAHALFKGFEPTYLGLQTRKDGPTRIFDHITTQALSRIVLETYLTYFHIFQQPSDNKSQREFRFCAWRLASLLAEGKWHSATGSDLPKNWSGAIAVLKETLAMNVNFLRLDGKERNRILNGKWRRPPWSFIAQQAGLPKTVSAPLYNMLSESMHSGSFAAFTVVQAGPPTQKKLVETDLFLIMLIMGKTLHSHLDLLELQQDLRGVIEYLAAAWSSDQFPPRRTSNENRVANKGM